MKPTPNSIEEMLAFARAEHAQPSRNWKNDCQMFARRAYGDLDGGFGSAIAQWDGAPADHKHRGGDPDEAPLGALLCFVRRDGLGFGHIMPAARPFPNGTAAAWSNDLVRTGFIDKAARTAPITEWGHRYLGYLWTVNGYEIPLAQKTPVGRPVVHLDRILAALRTDVGATQGHQTAPAQVKRVERALAAEHLLAPQWADDGSFGSTTVAAYAAWQRHLGYRGADADGVPGLASLRELGRRHAFDVAK